MPVFYTYDDKEKERKTFLETLYHDRRNGQMILLHKDRNQMIPLSTCDIDELELAATGTDVYTTVSTFKGNRRTSVNVFNYGSIYIDLDCHSENSAQVENAKKLAAEILEVAYADGLLAVPTMITDTGRGYGLQYVLTRSIANTWKTEKIRAFYKRVRKALIEKYTEILSVAPQAAQPDTAVQDDARVCRIPGTYNVAADAYCRLVSVSGKRYELSQIVQDCHLWDWKPDEVYKREKEEKESRRKARVTAGKVVSFADYAMPFLSARLDQLTKLQDLRGNGCEGYREQILFIAYSTLAQIDRSTAALKLQELNARFANPLDQMELDHIVAETDSSIGIDHRGFYKLKNTYLIERLGLSDDEIKAVGLNMGWRRTAERQAARDKRKELREKVIGLLKQDDYLTYEEISAIAGVSRRKICTIAREEGLMRYKKVADRIGEQKKDEAKIISFTDVREHGDSHDRSAHFAIKSVCVHLTDPSEPFFSTPAERGAGEDGLTWFGWLQSRASIDVVAQEILTIYQWSGWDSLTFGSDFEVYMDRQMPLVMKNPDRLADLCMTVSKKFFRYYKDELGYLFGIHNIADVLPTVWNLFVSFKNRKTAKRRFPVVDVVAETSEQRAERINRYLKKYKDERFDIIEASDEYQIRLDPDVIRMVKVVCMQVNRLKRDYFLIEKKQVPTKDIKQCFDSLTYKDLAIICERMQHHGMLQTLEKPFFYVLQVVWKYKHQDAAEAQADRLMKNTNSFFDFETHNYEDLDALAMRKALRRLQDQKGIGVSIGNE